MEKNTEVPQKTKPELPYDSAIPLLGMYLEKTLIWKDTCTAVFTASAVRKAKTCKQSKCPPTEERIKKIRHIHTSECYSAVEWNNAVCTNMDGPRDCHAGWSKSDREKQMPLGIAYVWNLKYGRNELIYRTETGSRTQRPPSGLGAGTWEGWARVRD